MKNKNASDIIIVLENNLSNFAKENGMKKLKKILLAVLILALIATAVVVTVLADDSGEEGVATEVTVTEAQALLDAVSEKTTYEQKSTQLKAVYAYIFNEANPLDPYSEGYDELLTAYSDATLAVAQGLLADYAAATSAATKEAKLIAAYSHYKGAPIAPDYESLNPDGYEAWQTFRLEYTTEAVKVLSSYLLPVRSAETLDERHAALKTASSKFSTRALYFAYDTNDRDIATEIPGLTDFVHEYNRWCMSVLSDYVDAVTSPKEMTAARKKYVSPDHVFSTDPTYFNSVYLATVEKLDLNIIKYANELLDNVTVTPENYRTEALDAINAVYSYLDSTRCILRKACRYRWCKPRGASEESQRTYI